jgi:hypothetical protein
MYILVWVISYCLACTMQFCKIVCHTVFTFVFILNLYDTLYSSAFRWVCMLIYSSIALSCYCAYNTVRYFWRGAIESCLRKKLCSILLSCTIYNIKWHVYFYDVRIQCSCGNGSINHIKSNNLYINILLPARIEFVCTSVWYSVLRLILYPVGLLDL